jgi:drug/metabolite transporter (DMT)-like permease
VSNNDKPKYWFPAKRYGWGWGPPTAWQGWGVLLAYFALVLAGIPFIQIGAGNVAYVVYVLVLTAVLVGVCWLTGERPRWRWGKRDA